MSSAWVSGLSCFSFFRLFWSLSKTILPVVLNTLVACSTQPTALQRYLQRERNDCYVYVWGHNYACIAKHIVGKIDPEIVSTNQVDLSCRSWQNNELVEHSKTLLWVGKLLSFSESPQGVWMQNDLPQTECSVILQIKWEPLNKAGEERLGRAWV